MLPITADNGASCLSEPAPIHQLNINLVHDTDNIETLIGTLSNPFQENEITIYSGENLIDLPQEIIRWNF